MAAHSSTAEFSGARSADEVHISGFASRPTPPHQLRAGPLSLCFDAGGLRWVCLGNTEVVHGIYVAVRDENWGTVPGRLNDLQIREDAESFRITFLSEHQRNEIDFAWRATIEGRQDGSIAFSMEGEARTTFRRNRIGFCVLHPTSECAGARCRVRHSNGVIQPLRFPGVIAAEQPVAGFRDLQGLAHEAARGLWAELSFEGELFEMEDQRNWIDSSFKTYCTPLCLPRPVTIEAGTKILQRVTLRMLKAPEELEASWPVSNESSTCTAPALPPGTVIRHDSRRPWVTSHAEGGGDDVALEIDFTQRSPLPALGLQASVVGALSDTEFTQHAARLRMLGLAHLRCDVRLADFNWRQVFLAASREAGALSLPLELAIHLAPDPSEAESRLGELTVLVREMPDNAPGWRGVKRILVLQDGQMSTTRTALRLVRSQLDWMAVPIGVGTDADLYHFNLQRPPGKEADFVFWSMNPQVHAFDNASIAETPAGAADQVRSVREYFPGKPICVTPVTFKPRFNPVAIKSESPANRDELAYNFDIRQLSLFGAAWTLAMIKALSEAGVESITLYETTGVRGVMEGARESMLAGGVFPLFHVLADVAGFNQFVRTRSSQPSRVEALTLMGSADGGCILLANSSDRVAQVNLTLPGEFGECRMLDQNNVREAMRHPEVWRKPSGKPAAVTSQIRLLPYALARLDFSLVRC